MNTLERLPKNAYLILDYIKVNGPRTQKNLNAELPISLRALRYALERMEKSGLIEKRANLLDVRSSFYVLTPGGMELGVHSIESELAEA